MYFNDKKRQRLVAIIALVLVAAMILTTVISAFM